MHNSCTSEKSDFKNFSNESLNFNLWLNLTLKQKMCENLKFVKAKLGDIIFETDPVHISYVVKEDFKIHVMST